MRIRIPEEIEKVRDLTAGDVVRYNKDEYQVLIQPDGEIMFRKDTGFTTFIYIRKMCGDTSWPKEEFIRKFPKGHFHMEH